MRWSDMGAQANYGALASGGWLSHLAGLHPSLDDRLVALPVNDWQCRGPRTWKDRNKWVSLWPTSRFAGGSDSGQGYVPIGQGMGETGQFEPFSCDGEGTQSKRFLRGSCVDASDVPIANAIVQGFRTVDDLYLGEVQANTDGTYGLGVEVAAGTACYLVAYKAGSPDIGGTTVNTLTPTNVDGS